MNYLTWSLFVLLLPLASFVLLGIWGRKYFNNGSGIAATIAMGGVLLFSLLIANQYFFVQGLQDGKYPIITPMYISWLQFGAMKLAINLGILLDPISVMMLVVISTVSFMVHLFSLGYMKGEDRAATYYSFLGLFTFGMLGLVISFNIFQMYMFWELVGVSSYLLIGFYFLKPSAVSASKKAFIVTRFADLFFLIGILIVGFQAGSLDFNLIIERLTDRQSPEFVAMATGGFLGMSALTWALCLVFIGGAGKSAMFPLHIWLPDAMEAPTPVSALIHAATMVVAGVYLVARLFPVYYVNGAALSVVTWVGAFSALFAAIIACTQTDIKRILAYSTMSQIGYMMFSLGVSGYGGELGLGFTASMFHLFTHAFFKSLLFLCAGVIIHFVHTNEMGEMGNLRKYMPVTHVCFLIGCLAIAGVPPLAGFFSKEAILAAAYAADKWVYFIGLFTALLTAFYMFRLYFSLFWRKPRNYKTTQQEAPWSMKLPLLVLSILSVSAGFVGFSSWVSADRIPFTMPFHWQFSLPPVFLVLVGIGAAAWLYRVPSNRPENLATGLGSLYQYAYRKFYIDEMYQFVTKQIIFPLIGKPVAKFDRQVVDGMVNGAAEATQAVSYSIKGWQSGKVQQYALWFLCGVLILGLVLIYCWP